MILPLAAALAAFSGAIFATGTSSVVGDRRDVTQKLSLCDRVNGWEVYHLRQAIPVTVMLSSVSHDLPVMVRWRSQGKDFRQSLHLPVGWTPSIENSIDFIPPGVAVVAWPGLARPAFIVLCQRWSGVYGVQSPIAFALVQNRFRLITKHPGNQEFTDRGSFFVAKDQMYVWDYAMDTTHCHACPQPYWLKAFTWTNGRWKAISQRMTQKSYADDNCLREDVSHDQLARSIPASADPLREFGMRWQWWYQLSPPAPCLPTRVCNSNISQRVL